MSSAFPIAFSPLVVVWPKDIVQVQGEGNYSRLFLNNGQSVVVSCTLRLVEKRLPIHFIRIHKSHVVNVHYFEKIMRRQKQVRLTNGLRLPISRRRASWVEARLGDTAHSD